eukprot:XP_001691621.1 predicted protein [Chlamydomonas reinhardtii]
MQPAPAGAREVVSVAPSSKLYRLALHGCRAGPGAAEHEGRALAQEGGHLRKEKEHVRKQEEQLRKEKQQQDAAAAAGLAEAGAATQSTAPLLDPHGDGSLLWVLFGHFAEAAHHHVADRSMFVAPCRPRRRTSTRTGGPCPP